MKILAISIVLAASLLLPAGASAHDWTQADGQAVDAMGYRVWAYAHNAAAPSDPVPTCIALTAPPTPQPSLEGVNRCTQAETSASVQAAYQQAAADQAALQAYGEALAAYAYASARHYDSPTTYTCSSDDYGSYSSWHCSHF